LLAARYPDQAPVDVLGRVRRRMSVSGDPAARILVEMLDGVVRQNRFI